MKTIIFASVMIFSSIFSAPAAKASVQINSIKSGLFMDNVNTDGGSKRKFETNTRRSTHSCLNKKGCSKPKMAATRHKGCPATNY